MSQWSELQQHLGYVFQDESRLIQALTHRSAGSKHNERLEFLGDVVLSAVITRWMFETYPQFTEGQLSELRAQLVNKKQLVVVAKQLLLNDALIVGPGEKNALGHYRESILANTVEALIGAIFLDSDWQKVDAVIRTWYQPTFDKIGPDGPIKHSKTLLQEYAQGNQLTLPEYHVTRTVGRAHQCVFYVRCQIAELHHTTHGHGRSKQQAEQVAAQAYLIWLEEQKHGRA